MPPFKIFAYLGSFAAMFAAQGPAAALEPKSHFGLVQTTLDTHVLPAFETLKIAAARLPENVARVCEAADDGAREELGSAFRDTVLAWAGVEYLRFGPMTEGARRERLSFWPDPRGIMNRQLRQLIASGNAARLDNGGIARQSAAVQGLPALEFLMVDKEHPLGPGEAHVFRCKLALAIAQNVRGIAAELVDGWEKSGGWKDRMLRPGSDNDTYKVPQESAGELVKALLIGLQLIGDSQLKPQLDNLAFIGPFAKSNLSRAYFQAGVASLDKFYEAMDLESYLPEDKDWIKNWVGGAWRTLRASDGAGGRVSSVDRVDAPKIRKVFDMIGGLKKLAGGEMAAAAGLTVGFNELDGD